MANLTGHTLDQYETLELIGRGNGLVMGAVLVAVVVGLGGCQAAATTPEASEVGAQPTATCEPTKFVPTNTPTATSTDTPTPTGTPTPDPAALARAGVSRNDDWIPYIQEFDGVEMALVPAGCFMMGSSDEEIDHAFELCSRSYGGCVRSGFEDEKPQHEVCFEEPFWIDVYEVTNGQYGSTGCEYFSSDPDQPRNCVNWADALAHCERRGARLPTEAEWEYAARGPDGLVYPWGNTFDCSHGNFDDETDYDPNVIEGGAGCDGFAFTSPVGSFLSGISWVGVYDLSGNVLEWMNDRYAVRYPNERQVNPTGPERGTYRAVRGGSWSSSSAITLRAADRVGDYPPYVYNSSGFRCARSYNP